MLNGLHKLHLNQPKNLIVGHLDISFITNKFSNFNNFALNEANILYCLLSQSNIADLFPSSQTVVSQAMKFLN